MRIFFTLLFRVLAVALSFAVSTLAAAVFLTFALFLDGDVSWLSEDIVAAGGAITFTGVAWLQIASQSFAPAMAILLGLELGRYKSLTINVLAGGACAVIIMVMTNPSASPDQGLPYDSDKIWMAAIAAGFVAGFVHWILAGHRAGRWMNGPLSGSAPSKS